MQKNSKNDFSEGSIWKTVLALAIPMSMAQLVQVCYSIIDRIYIGHLQSTSSLALTGLGLTFPVITIISAFTNLFSTGGVPLFSIARGKQNHKQADIIMGNTFSLLLVSSILITIIFMLVMKPLLYLFGASDVTYPYAREYMTIYLLGTVFSMTGSGMNGFINSQGFGKTGMMTVLFGAIMNVILDPIFIFAFGLGIRGAAIATVISQAFSALWVLHFLHSPKSLYHIHFSAMRLYAKTVREISALGLAGFFMGVTNGVVQIACNTMLHSYGGDLYVGIMTVLNSIRDIVQLPISGLGTAAQPVMGYNYGAHKYDRVKQTIHFATVLCIIYMISAWVLVMKFATPIISVFTSDPTMISLGRTAIRIYFSGFFISSLQYSGQAVFVGLGQSKFAAVFSLFRKVGVVIPLTLILPVVGMGVNGVLLAEPISNVVSSILCFITMLVHTRKLLKPESESLAA